MNDEGREQASEWYWESGNWFPIFFSSRQAGSQSCLFEL